MKSPLWVGLLLAIGLGLVWQTNSAQAQDKTLVWDRYDVNLTVEPNSDILVEEILKEAKEEVHVLRDPTRGGMATSLNEIALQADVGISINFHGIVSSMPNDVVDDPGRSSGCIPKSTIALTPCQ